MPAGEKEGILARCEQYRNMKSWELDTESCSLLKRYYWTETELSSWNTLKYQDVGVIQLI